jgi:hypothetical protein
LLPAQDLTIPMRHRERIIRICRPNLLANHQDLVWGKEETNDNE